MTKPKNNSFYNGGKNKYKNKPFQSGKQDHVKSLLSQDDNKDKEDDSFSSPFSDSASFTIKPINPDDMQEFIQKMTGGIFGGFASSDSMRDNMRGRSIIASKELKEKIQKKIMKPKQIKEHLDQYIIGQEDAKIALAVAVYNHYRRINTPVEKDGIEIQKSNILMMGNSGCGKTLLAQTIAKILDVPFVTADATAFTPMGYVGRNIEEIIKDLYNVSNGDKKKTEQGIVYIDEFDKLAGTNTSGHDLVNVSNILSGDTQASFLKLIEGEEISLGGTTINTKNILFICGGAFSGIEKLVKSKTKDDPNIGFGVVNNNKQTDEDNMLDKIGTEQVIKYGLMPEIVGRLPILLKLKPLKVDDLVKILTEPKNAIIKQYKKLLKMDKVILEFSEDALEKIAELAIENKTGARGLRAILERTMTKLIFNLPEDDHKKECLITGENIQNETIPELIPIQYSVSTLKQIEQNS